MRTPSGSGSRHLLFYCALGDGERLVLVPFCRELDCFSRSGTGAPACSCQHRGDAVKRSKTKVVWIRRRGRQAPRLLLRSLPAAACKADPNMHAEGGLASTFLIRGGGEGVGHYDTLGGKGARRRPALCAGLVGRGEGEEGGGLGRGMHIHPVYYCGKEGRAPQARR